MKVALWSGGNKRGMLIYIRSFCCFFFISFPANCNSERWAALQQRRPNRNQPSSSGTATTSAPASASAATTTESSLVVPGDFNWKGTHNLRWHVNPSERVANHCSLRDKVSVIGHSSLKLGNLFWKTEVRLGTEQLTVLRGGAFTWIDVSSRRSCLWIW